MSQLYRKLSEQAERYMNNIKKPQVFDIKYIPKEIYLRDKMADIGTQLIWYAKSNKGKLKTKPIRIFGHKGSGKTVSVKFFLREMKNDFDFPMRIINCNSNDTSYRIMVSALEEVGENIGGRREGYSSVYKKFKNIYGYKSILALDEIDMLKDYKILYDIPRDTNIQLIVLTNKFNWYDKLSPDIKSSFMPKKYSWRPYGTEEIFKIIKYRAEEGLKEYDLNGLAYISKQTKQNYDSDIRKALETVFLCGVTNRWDKKFIDIKLEEAYQNIEEKEISGLEDKLLILLRCAIEQPITNKLYELFNKVLKRIKKKTYVKKQFFRLIQTLGNSGIVMISDFKFEKGLTQKIHVLVDKKNINKAFDRRFNFNFEHYGDDV